MNKESHKEDIGQIANSIDSHTRKELKEGLYNRAFARARCSVNATYGGNLEQVFWLVNSQNTRGLQIKKDFTGTGSYVSAGFKTTLETDGQAVYKNTKLGEILTKAYQGTYHYTTRTSLKRMNDIAISIHNRSVYTPTNDGASEIEIRIAGDTSYYRFQKLSDLLKAKREDQEKLHEQKEILRKLKEEQERLAAEKAAAEKAAKEKAEREEFERLEALRIQKEKEEQERLADIERLERSINETKTLLSRKSG